MFEAQLGSDCVPSPGELRKELCPPRDPLCLAAALPSWLQTACLELTCFRDAQQESREQMAVEVLFVTCCLPQWFPSAPKAPFIIGRFLL